MSLIKWSPFFFEPFDGMDKMMEEMGRLSPRASGGIVPPVDMYETEEAVVVETSMPGVDPNKIEISIENNTLSIKAESERKTEVDDKNYYRKEVRYGTVFRQVVLPGNVQDKGAQAAYTNGILKITLPKAQEKKSIKVEVTKN